MENNKLVILTILVVPVLIELRLYRNLFILKSSD